ncbi:SusC/RagA family TonB-linked outer membrane protein [Chryseobacterium sp. GMJ5]|uniref:SusC/RagA family TonB-linked outer membrane protein n=1 Tax=Chryseobacterium gilvum TaxID=2976534 RepID=A0ABT2VVI5_9FLAO|nr:SusC/RagA family TonB-linked outer membrane protein [Chryseobacterium gilvum]MCU7614006.1 SusC/RagA family TonB-linked outer membrane protein [Chryseobacterium gilvum]
MKQSNVKYSCLIAVLYFGMNVSGQTAPNDTLPKEQKIEEVVLIGYGSQKKENVTGSIGTISAKDLADKPNANPISSIQGKLSGVQILNSGAPGGSPRVDIRGVSSLTGKTVFIVDGMITDDISFLNPQDIESMSVLKDPSSLAIFGARASNGAVIIKTKMGRGKKPVFSFNSYLGFKKVTNIPEMANSDQYIELYNEKLRNEGNTDPTKFLSRANFPADTNWFKEIFRTSIINANDFSAAGNAGKLNYYLSVGNLQDEGNLAAGRGINSGSGFNRLNTKVNLTYKINDNITVGDNFSFSKMRTDIAQNPLLDAYTAPPIFSVMNPGTGGYQFFNGYSIPNPRAKLDLFRSQTRQERLLNNVWGEYKFLKDFALRVSYTSDNINTNKYEFTPTLDYQPQPGVSKLVTRDSRDRNYVWDNTLTWKRNFGNHNFEVLAGFSRTRNSYSETYAQSQNVFYNGTNESLSISNGTDILIYNDDRDALGLNQDQYRIESFFGRVNYDYKGKYLLNASIRRDGSSQISTDRYKTFPAVSAGWVISKEDFMSEQNLFNLLKLRASYGELGNPNVSRRFTLNRTIIEGGAYYGNTGSPAATIDQIIDPTIGWETTSGGDLGLEMALLNNKLKIDAAYFSKDSKDVVYGVFQGAISGASNWRDYTTNAYSFNNKGFEVSINYNTKINDNVGIGVYGNYTGLKNKITSVYGGSYLEAGASLFGNNIIRLQEGQAVGSYYGYQVVGVFQNQADVTASAIQNQARPGAFKFADLDGNGIIDTRDKTFLGSPIPKGTYGFGVNMNIYDFDFAIDFQGVFGNKIYNYNREQRFGNENWDLDFYNNRWTGAGTSNSYSMVTNDQAIILPSSFYVEDGSYIRIRNVQIGYNLPKVFSDALSITKLRLYVSAQNPWTSFKYKGFSPEIMNTDRVQMGVDQNIYPISAIYTFGMNLTF